MHPQPTRRKRFRLKAVIGLLIFAGLALGVWAFGIEPGRLVTSESTIALPQWPAAFRQLRLAVISDLHAGAPHITPRQLERIVATTNAARPELVLLLGDFVTQDVLGGTFIPPETLAEKLKDLRASLGVVAVLGNHDWRYDGQRIRRALEQAGIRVLENEVMTVTRQGGALWLAGLSDYWMGRPDIPGTLGKITDDAPVIALTHNPDLFPRVPARVSLTLAGHTHGGQVNLPFVGRLIVPSDFGQRFARGHVQEEGRHLFVTSGIGTSILPVRFRVPPEIAIVTLTAQPAPD
jgi:predicted MPP superfamily phosphohydrolase